MLERNAVKGTKAGHRYGYHIVKRLFDFVAALLAAVVLSPLMLIIAVCVVIEDGFPILYRAKRVGRGGKTISVYKFRSMKKNADRLEDMLTPEELEEYHRNFKLDHDPRITKVGAFLRKTSLDELPQLYNIIGGSLSLVGPRPVLQEETELYGENRDLLLSCKPGLTGLWQVMGRSNVSYEDGKRQALELQYVRECGIGMDIKILLKTFGVVLRMDGAR